MADSSTYVKEKYCCSGCAEKRRCHICGEQTEFACSDCRIDLGVTVYVCSKSVCLDKHETKCGHALRALAVQLKEVAEELLKGLCCCCMNQSDSCCPVAKARAALELARKAGL